MDTPTRSTSLDEGLLTNVERPTSAVQAEIPMKMVGDTRRTNLLGSDVPTADVHERWFHSLRFPKIFLYELSGAHRDKSGPSATGDHHVRSPH